jgi:hypothetical protein
MEVTMYTVYTKDASGRVYAHIDFSRYGDANRYAHEHCPREPGHHNVVMCGGKVQVAYVSLSAFKYGSVSMVDDCCACDPEDLAACVAATLAYFERYFESKGA